VITWYAPSIRAQDHDAFRRIASNSLADSFEKWSNIMYEKIANERGVNRLVVETEVSPDEFAAFCRTYGHDPSVLAVDHFAQHVGSLKKGSE
jgi:hypothetical protein